jgi:serine/threonine protein kinase
MTDTLRKSVAVVYDRFDCDFYAFVEKWEEPQDPGSKCPGLPEALVQSVMRQLLGAVAHMHTHDYAHCDIKPENLLVKRQSRTIALADFGHATRIHAAGYWYTGPATSRALTHGTEAYQAPEMWQGTYNNAMSDKADVWACAATAVFALTTDGVRHSKKDGGFGMLSIPWASLAFASENCKDFIRCALVEDPRERPSAAELLEHLWLSQAAPGKPQPMW